VSAPPLDRTAATLDPPLTLADVGARGGPPESWRALAPPCRIVGFEADEEECRRLAATDTSGAVRYEPVALGARAGPATLYLTEDPTCSSLYPPDPAAVAAHPALAVCRLVGRRDVELETLDGWCAANDVRFDALKLDVQGAELDVLSGATRSLADVVMLELEVELNPIYAGQPLFGDVDRFLRDRGFTLWRLAHLVHYGRREADISPPVTDLQVFDWTTVPVVVHGGQLYWAHAYYVAGDVLEPDAPDERVRRAAVAADGFGFADLAALLNR
jgi:FkbM family methyltransferase